MVEVTAVEVDKEMTELEGPYECPHCGGHFMIDATFVDQVQHEVVCMYCPAVITIPES